MINQARPSTYSAPGGTRPASIGFLFRDHQPSSPEASTVATKGSVRGLGFETTLHFLAWERVDEFSA